MHVWRIPGEFIEEEHLHIGLNSYSRYMYNVENMKEYEITNKFHCNIEFGNTNK